MERGEGKILETRNERKSNEIISRLSGKVTRLVKCVRLQGGSLHPVEVSGHECKVRTVSKVVFVPSHSELSELTISEEMDFKI